jgi:nucleoside-diphosphate-sugar epimerase
VPKGATVPAVWGGCFREDRFMSTALVTGARGQVGRRIVDRLEQAGWDARGFDLRSGDDVRDQGAMLDAAEGCEVIVHAGAIAHDSAGTPADIVSTIVFGTWHVLLAAEISVIDRSDVNTSWAA